MSSSNTKSKSKATTGDKPKREMNPILKSMNDYRNNVIGEHIGSKAPRKTSTIFTLTLALARTEMGLSDGDKNTVDVVSKASEIFQKQPDKYVKLAAVEDAKKAEAKENGDEETVKSKKKSAKKETSKEASKEESDAKTTKKTKSSKNKKLETSDDDDVEVEVEKPKAKNQKASKPEVKKSPSKKKVVKKVVEESSDSDSDSDSD
jgi:hypothetical protein